MRIKKWLVLTSRFFCVTLTLYPRGVLEEKGNEYESRQAEDYKAFENGQRTNRWNFTNGRRRQVLY